MRGIAIVLLAAACGGSSVPNRATITGKVDGTPLLTTNAAVFVVHGAAPTVDVLLSNLADGCNANAANLKGKQVLSLGVTSVAGGAVDAGDFPVYDQQSGSIPQGTVVFADYHSTTDGCADSTPPNTLGASGHVALTKVNLAAGGEVQGTFDLLLQNGDHLKGTFDAPVCGDRPDGGVDAGCH